MSVRVMSWVWSHSAAEPVDRLVLLAIADCANDEGADAYPSMAALVAKTRLHERSVQRSISHLVEAGELSVQKNGGPKGANRYRVMMPPPPLTPSTPGTPPGGTPPPRHTATPAERHPTPGTPPPHPRHTAGGTPGTPPPGTVLDPSSSVREPSRSRTRDPATTGTRIPDDFGPTEEMIAWAKEHTPLVGRKETDAFVDYWRGKAGADGKKVDWPATWRNWMRKAQTQAERDRPRNTPRPDPAGRILKPETAANLALVEKFAAQERPQRREIGDST